MFTEVRYATISSDAAGQRIDNYLINQLKGVPKSRVYRLLRKGEVRVNKKRAKPEYKLQSGDEVRIPPVHQSDEAEKIKPSKSVQDQLASRIVYEDGDMLILNKPAGMSVHGGTGVVYGAIDIVRQLRPDNDLLSLVHRLDRDTSGCLVFAKNRATLVALHELLRTSQWDKRYLALVHGHWPEDLTEIDAALQKNSLSAGERKVRVDEEGKASKTRFKVREYFTQGGVKATLLEVRLETGRTHQIRVHTAFAGHPVVGDDKYGDRSADKQMPQGLGKHLFLHAYSVAFQLPGGGRKIRVEAELDAVKTAQLETLRFLHESCN